MIKSCFGQSWALQELHPFGFSKLSIFSWRAIARKLSMLMSCFAGHIDSWLAIARQEKIDNLEKPNGCNSCNAQLWPTSLDLDFKTGCQNWLYYICLLIFYFWNCIHSHLASSDFFMASEIKPHKTVLGIMTVL